MYKVSRKKENEAGNEFRASLLADKHLRTLKYPGGGLVLFFFTYFYTIYIYRAFFSFNTLFPLLFFRKKIFSQIRHFSYGTYITPAGHIPCPKCPPRPQTTYIEVPQKALKQVTFLCYIKKKKVEVQIPRYPTVAYATP